MVIEKSITLFAILLVELGVLLAVSPRGVQSSPRRASSQLPRSVVRCATVACPPHGVPVGTLARRGSLGQTIQQLNTPLNNPLQEDPLTEIEVTDSAHPLFGRRFSVLSISSPPQGLGHVFVVYQAHMRLCIPLSATNLAPPRPTGKAKLTLSAVTDLISLVEQCEVLCQLHQQRSGSDCLQNSKLKSSTISRRSSRR
jgi:hypothetical protein